MIVEDHTASQLSYLMTVFAARPITALEDMYLGDYKTSGY
jgi:hypothetical protein